MIIFLLGVLTLLVVMSALGMFSRAHIRTIKAFGIWIAGIGGMLLAALMLLAGKEVGGLAVLGILGPLLWSLRAPRGMRRPGARSGAQPSGVRGGSMTTDEALAVLGLARGADRAAIQAAYVRLMQAAHPDRGGSDWLASRINQARDVLLG